MKNLFYDLPVELQNMIYEYDNTWLDIFREKVLGEDGLDYLTDSLHLEYTEYEMMKRITYFDRCWEKRYLANFELEPNSPSPKYPNIGCNYTYCTCKDDGQWSYCGTGCKTCDF